MGANAPPSSKDLKVSSREIVPKKAANASIGPSNASKKKQSDPFAETDESPIVSKVS